jgi:Zn-dependent protease with chaperone function
MLVKRISKLTNIDPKSWEHPADTAALSAVKQLKGLDELIKTIMSFTSERSLRLMVLASSVKVSENQYPKVNNILNNVVDTFDWPYKPEIFISLSPNLNAGVLGVKNPFIIINSAVIKNFDEKEITAIISHEMGHIMSGHSLYKTLIWVLTNISLSIIPMAQLLIYPIMAALSEWNKKSELTADRAEILGTQNPETSYNILMRLAGAEDLTQVNLNAFFEQAQEYENQKSLLDSIHKVLNQLWLSHPYPVVRLQELQAWSVSGFYQTILDGNYLRRDRINNNVNDDINAGFEYYKETLKESDDPLSKLVVNISEGIEKATGDIGEKLKDLFK